VDVSSGTYIRAIARDLGSALGVGGHLAALRRTRIGAHSVDSALPVERLDDAAAVAGRWIAPLDALAHLPRIDLDDAGAAAILQGRGVRLPEARVHPAGPVRIAADGRLLAIGEVLEDALRPRKVFGHA
jgi:tRNA pseudouridine55 synthase